jgi:hypothetical protein
MSRAHRQNRRVLHFALGEQGIARGAGADVDEQHSQVALVGGEHGLGGRQRLEDHLRDLDTGPVDASEQRLRPRHLPGDQMDLDLQAAAQHSQGIADATLLVDDELLGDGVQNLAIRRQRRRLRRTEGALDVRFHDLAVLARHRHHAARVHAAHVGPGDTDVGARDLHSGHDLGLLARGLERFDGRLDIDDVAAPRAPVRGRAPAGDLQRALGVALPDEHRDLGGADVDPYDVLFCLGHDPEPSLRVRVER